MNLIRYQLFGIMQVNKEGKRGLAQNGHNKGYGMMLMVK